MKTLAALLFAVVSSQAFALSPGKYTTSFPTLPWINLKADGTFSSECAAGGGGGPRLGKWNAESGILTLEETQGEPHYFTKFTYTDSALGGADLIVQSDDMVFLLQPSAVGHFVPTDALTSCVNNDDCAPLVCYNPANFIGTCQ